jgi:hypothetical protein
MIIESSDKNQIYYLINKLDKQRQLIKNIRIEMSDESDILKKDVFALLKSESWPLAVPPSMIFSSPEELKLRACVILDKFFPNLKGKSLLDYGCGNDLVVMEARKRGAEAFGYDFVPSLLWQFCDVKLPNKKFDYVLLHDMLDHAISVHHVDIMKHIASVSNENTVVKVRIHPWTSRHGSHSYKFINKAFVHLIFANNELLNIGCCDKSIPTIPILDPVKHYEGVFAASGWRIVKSVGVYDEVESFFTEQEEIKQRLYINNI